MRLCELLYAPDDEAVDLLDTQNTVQESRVARSTTLITNSG